MPGSRYVTRTTLPERAAAWIAALSPWSRDRALPDLDRAALLVLDVQRYFAEPSSHAYLPALEAVLPNVLSLVEAFAEAGRPVVYTRHGSVPGSEGMMQRWWGDDLQRDQRRWQLVEALTHPPDLLLDKDRYSALAGTDLEAWLRRRSCEAVVICGVMTHLCCETTARHAFVQDLAPVMVADACATRDEDLHLGALRGLAHGVAVIATTAQVIGGAGLTAAGTENSEEGAGEGPVDLRCDLAIVGAGPAGLAAAIQATRAGLDVALLDPGPPGGAARTADNVENYPGFPGGISGQALMDRFSSQAAQLGVEVLPLEAASISEGGGGLTLDLAGDRGRVRARSVILATGTRPRGLPLPGLANRAVSRVDALPRDLRGQRLLVVGGGEAALDQALMAHRRGAEVRVVVRGRRPRAMDLLVRRCRRRGIQLDLEANLVNVLGVGDGEPLTVELDRGGERLEVETDAVVVCIGKDPLLPALPPGAEPAAADRLGRTAVDGLYVVGDACRGIFRQVSIAVGDGVAAAMHAVAYIGNRIPWRE